MKSLRILGTRGVPAAHGGFETFAERLALHLVESGWRVTVYCQHEGRREPWYDEWRGVQRVNIAVPQAGAPGTMAFDWACIRHAARSPDLCLTLGYNTAVFCAWLRLRGVPNVINMDGIEWRRAKWSTPARAWLWFNDWAGCLLGTHLVADHPEIARHLSTRGVARKTTTIAYGAEAVTEADPDAVTALGLQPGRYLTVVARPEPENSILEIVRGYSRRPRGMPLVVLGRYEAGHAYHDAVQRAAGPEVRFLGAIYDRRRVEALRFHATGYVHGHQVGGTNPSLVEALGAGNAVIAHDNPFNRWVVGEGGRYFADEHAFADVLDALEAEPQAWQRMSRASRARFEEAFTWREILGAYEALLSRCSPDSNRPIS